MSAVTKLTYVLLCVECVLSQTSDAANCNNGQPTFICNAGDSVPSNPQGQSNSSQGRPGKAGVKGGQGAKGEKGDPGTPEDITARLRQLEEQVAGLVHKINELHPPVSCDDIHGTADLSGVFSISPDPGNVSPFQVYCNFTGETTETILDHDSVKEIAVTNCEPQRCYKRKIKYEVSMEQIAALINKSQSCRQFIKYRCIASLLFRAYIPTFAAWLSRDGSERLYWGGATSQRERYCACGETGTCLNNDWKCNCDINTETETSDEGYLMDKDSLPVTGLHLGDLGANVENGWHTLGPLICTGRNPV